MGWPSREVSIRSKSVPPEAKAIVLPSGETDGWDSCPVPGVTGRTEFFSVSIE